ncbi:MAG TPA: hypothetical protein VG318_07700 [Actinomycetota bacterium]|nr:hypothetical protein [Actinomycetota bacterium]
MDLAERLRRHLERDPPRTLADALPLVARLAETPPHGAEVLVFECIVPHAQPDEVFVSARRQLWIAVEDTEELEEIALEVTARPAERPRFADVSIRAAHVHEGEPVGGIDWDEYLPAVDDAVRSAGILSAAILDAEVTA